MLIALFLAPLLLALGVIFAGWVFRYWFVALLALAALAGLVLITMGLVLLWAFRDQTLPWITSGILALGLVTWEIRRSRRKEP